MADRRQILNNQDLEQRLVELGRHVALPAGHRVARRVHISLAAEAGAAKPRVPRFWRRGTRPINRALVGLALCLAFLVLVLVVSSGARAAVSGWFHIAGVEITRVQPGGPVPSPVGTKLDLGRRTTLTAAQRHLRFRIALPRYRALGPPDEIYSGGHLRGQVALVYRVRAGFPPAAGTGVGMLITEFRSDLAVEIIKKLAFLGTTIENVRFPGAQGVWLTGSPHFFGYAMPDGSIVEEPLRLAGNTLLWQRDDVTYRLEGSVSKDIAIRIAESIR
jgi:hypothetical protein